MTTDTLIEKLAALDAGTDFSDANTYMQLLYGDGAMDETAPEASAVEGESAPEVAAEAPAEAVAEEAQSSEAPAAAASEEQVQVEGVLTKDGKHVIPYDVLERTRKTAAQEEARARELAQANERLEAELKALKQGAKQEQSQAVAPKFSPARIAELKENFPEVAELMEAQNDLLAQLQAAKTAAPAVAPQQAEAVDIQALIDKRPMLARWQSAGGVLWKEAVALDEQLQRESAWALKSTAERFAEVERRVAEIAGIPVQAPAPVAQPAAQPVKPAKAIKAQAAPTPSITDFNGSAPVVADNPLDLPVGQAFDKAMSMSLEDIYRAVGVNL